MAKEKTPAAASLRIDSEYYDFSKFDLSGAAMEMRKAGAKNSLPLPGALPDGASVSLLLPSADYLGWHQKLPSAKPERFLSWHMENIQGGYHVEIDGGAKAELSLSASAPAPSCLHHVINVGKGAKLDLSIESSSIAKSTSRKIHAEVFEVSLAEDASLNLATVQDYSSRDLVFTHLFFRLGRFSRLSHFAGNFGGEASRLRIENHLQGTHAKAESHQVFFCEGEQFADVCASTYHHVPDTSGNMRAKGALTGSSRCAYKGYIKIGEGAKNTITHQSGTALLLSGTAQANVMPALDVENNEVEAGHGAAVGELSEDELTYLRSRGLSEEEARSLIVEGYFDELLAQFPHEKGRTLLRSHLEGKISSIKSKGKG